jgi:signal transduction histidine kinase
MHGLVSFLILIAGQPLSAAATEVDAEDRPPVVLTDIAQLFAEDSRWAQVEGKVTFAGRNIGKILLELATSVGCLTAELPDSSAVCLPLLLHSQVRVTGEREPAYAVDGYRSAVRLLVAQGEHLEIRKVASQHWTAYPLKTIGKARAGLRRTRFDLLRMQGRVTSVADPRRLWLQDASGEIAVHLAQPFQQTFGGMIEVLGQWNGVGTNAVLANAVWRKLDGIEKSLPLLRTTAEVHALKPQEADAKHAVCIRGVVTSRDANGGMVQDATRGVYVYGLKGSDSATDVRPGDYVEVEGVTVQGTFAPMIRCKTARRLGQGSLPNPVHPTWERLNNGSMDCQYIEIEGFVTEAYFNSLVLLMPEGHFGIALVPETGVDTQRLALHRYANKHVRIRGTVFATRNNETHRVRAGSIGLGNAMIGLGDPVTTLDKQIGELLQFDARAGGFHRVKVSGQILHCREREYYLSDGTNGLRFVTRSAADLVAGDQVEVVGFPRVAGSSPVLREASPRKTGKAALPPGRFLAAEALSSATNIGALVELESRLLGVRSNRTDVMLDLQAGPRSLTARLERKRGELAALPIGSRLRLTGVYAGHGRDRLTGAETDSSELLLNSPADIHVVERPSWWTPARAVTVISSLVGALLLVAGWVVSLRRRVLERTRQLEEQILGREHAERQHLLEAERSRLARDLHDELGANLTEISLLANVGAGIPPTLERAADRFRLIADKAGGVVDALDVIVWAVNPATDALQPFADYVSSFVREFLATCGIRCRLKVPIQFPAVSLDSQTRHNLFLAVKEALNNAARHSSALEVEFSIAIADGCLQIAITDHGAGFDASTPTAGMGLANLQRRLETIGGQCSIQSCPGAGTSVTMFLPLPADLPSSTLGKGFCV